MVATGSTLRARLEEQGYVVVPGVVPQQNLAAAVADIWRHTGAEPHDPHTWYRPDLVRPAGMVQMYHYHRYGITGSIHGSTPPSPTCGGLSAYGSP